MGNKIRCQALDSNGNRCKNIAKFKEHYHGDHEIYSYDEGLSWVEVFVCKKHQKTEEDSENFSGYVKEEDAVVLK